ncbi:nucleotidyltransferase family protein [Aquibium sp. ELW1220]|uniref:nucleotidyltransferase family protein n=1 Tax=Aquibium sp. ELW1220 TaxID=2976766 RepID=UPI0025B15093|nr:nucleotidyltransferase family protein [Aquibium sp. ELW1220]MDN2583191.1 nucleotidyltransferase family protein [Aquibium sp. ELW1220]
MTAPRSAVRRRFPDLGWAWPAGDLDLLIRAVAARDEDAAFAAARSWLSQHDIDVVGFREHRLLAALSERFGRRLAEFPAQPRLAGLQRMLWTRSRLAMREAEPVLAALTASGIPVMLMKGAARVAVEAGAERSRISHDIDLLVPPGSMDAAFECLVTDGWEPATGVSMHFLRGRLGAVRALNFLRGDYGDVDLHQAAFHPVHASAEDDAALWQRAVPAVFAGIAVSVPSTADRLALSIAHGSLDAHAHSDWLVDCDAAVRRTDLDWAAFLSVVEERGLAVPAAVALSYLVSVIGSPVPADVLEPLVARARGRSFADRLSVLLQARPRAEGERVLALARGLAKLRRMRAGPKARSPLPDDLLRGRAIGGATSPAPERPARFRADLPAGPDHPGRCRIRLVLDCTLPATRRRIEFELRSPAGHIARLRYRKLDRREGPRRLVFEGVVTLPEAGPLTLEARPARYLRRGAAPQDLALYGAVPFSIAESSLSA